MTHCRKSGYFKLIATKQEKILQEEIKWGFLYYKLRHLVHSVDPNFKFFPSNPDHNGAATCLHAIAKRFHNSFTHEKRSKIHVDNFLTSGIPGVREDTSNPKHPILWDRKLILILISKMRDLGIEDIKNGDGKTCLQIFEDRIVNKQLIMSQYDGAKFIGGLVHRCQLK